MIALIPLKLIKFWYPDSLFIFIRVWGNTMAILEEDLAVGLMAKLIFVPLFHDVSLVGKILSFIFRVTRIFVGVFAFIAATLFILVIGCSWFLIPLIIFLTLLLPSTTPALRAIWLFSVMIGTLGLILFIWRQFKPKKRVGQVKDIGEIWSAALVKSSDLVWEKMINTLEVKEILQSLEITSVNLPTEKVTLSDPLLVEALSQAQKMKAQYLTVGYFWVASLEQIPRVDDQLLKLNLKLDDIKGALSFLEFKRNKFRAVYLWDEDFAIKHLKGVNRGWLNAPTPSLDNVSVDLTREAAKGNFPDFIGRKEALDEVVNILSTEKGRNVLIVGNAGVGKSSLVNFLAKMIVSGNAPASLATKRVVSLDLARLLSGVRAQGDLAEKIKNIFEEVEFIENVILYIDEIQNLGIGDAGESFNLYSLLLPHLESDKFQVIASTEPENYSRILEKNSVFARLFTKVELPEANIAETLEILKGEAANLKKEKGVKVTFIALKEMAQLGKKLIHDRLLPDSAISIFNEAKAKASNNLVNSQVVKSIFSKRVNIPLFELGNVEKEELLSLESRIHKRLIDQEEAVKVVADTLRRSAASLREESRPIGSFLFVGPTGVGKTELAKTLSEIYFQDPSTFLRFDMSEYQTETGIDRLIGTVNLPGELTEAVRNKPYALILLDEFEKANPKILTLFLQVLDDGRLTDASGFTVDFTNTIIIATSNVGSISIAEGLKKGQSLESLREVVSEELLKVLKPELINRFDEIVIFKSLTQLDLQRIVNIKLTALGQNMKNQGYLIDFSPELIAELTKKGFDPEFGARPLRRLIQDTIEANLSKMILEGKLPRGEEFAVNEKVLGV